MKQLILLPIIGLLFVACSDNNIEKTAPEKTASLISETPIATTSAQKADIDSAKIAANTFAGALKSELVKAIKSGGLISALDVCNSVAMPITEQSANDHGVQISRVSLKNRNPENMPNAWQTKVLQDFDQRAANGEPINSIAYAGIIESSNKKQLHFMKALPTEKACLDCHGSHLSTEVSAKINALYPNDKAIGYSEGQVRGAIVVVKNIF